jgi:hypothetical protein
MHHMTCRLNLVFSVGLVMFVQKTRPSRIFVLWDIINPIMVNPTYLALVFLVRRGLSVTTPLPPLVPLVVLPHGPCLAQSLAIVSGPSVRTRIQTAHVSANLVLSILMKVAISMRAIVLLTVNPLCMMFVVLVRCGIPTPGVAEELGLNAVSHVVVRLLPVCLLS